MRGQVTTFEEWAGGGSITGDDGKTYRFDSSSIRSKPPLTVGQRVDFVGIDTVATEIFGLEEVGPALSVASSVGRVGAFDLGRVIQRTFTSIGQNWVLCLVVSTLLVGIPSLLQVYGQAEILMGENAYGWVIAVIGWVTWIIGAYVVQGMVIKASVSSFNGKIMGLGEAFGSGVRLFLPLLGLGIIVGLGTGLGFILLIVPGVILAVMWSASTGVLVVEKRGVFESLQRSRDLTRGYRWQVFGLAVIYVIASMLIGMLVGGIGAATGGSIMTGSTNLGVNLATTAVSNILTSVVGAAGAAALYFELRSAKEGVGPEELASVFD